MMDLGKPVLGDLPLKVVPVQPLSATSDVLLFFITSLLMEVSKIFRFCFCATLCKD